MILGIRRLARQTVCKSAFSPQDPSPALERYPSGTWPVVPVVHTPYDYYERII